MMKNIKFYPCILTKRRVKSPTDIFLKEFVYNTLICQKFDFCVPVWVIIKEVFDNKKEDHNKLMKI